MPQPYVTDVSPSRAIEGGRVTLFGEFGQADSAADVRIEGRPARTVFASPTRLSVIVPSGVGSCDQDHGWATERSGELARLSLLER